MAQAASLETAEHGLPGGNTALIGNTMENTYVDPNRVTQMGTSSHQISRIHCLKGLAPDAPPRLDAGVLEDSTGFAQLGNSLENKALRTQQADSKQGLSVPLPV